jgi:hypothetical protein
MGAKNRDANTAHERLQELFPDWDHTLKKRDKFSIREKGACYRLEKLGGRENVDYQVDGGLIPKVDTDNPKCDHLLLIRVSETEWIHVFIELKGTDVKHGLEQLKATLRHSLFNSLAPNERRVARLVGRSMPSSKNNPEIDRLKQSIAKLNCTFKTMKSNQAEDFETLKQLVGL